MIGQVPSERIRYWVVVAAGLVLLLWSNYYLRSTLESADVFLFDFYRYFYPTQSSVIFSPDYPKWRLLLPISSMTGSWSPMILVLTHFVTGWIGLAPTWYLANAVLILVSFAASWSVFRSRVFAFTLAIGMGFGTHLYYTYPNSGLIGFPLLFVYYELLLLCAYRVITSTTHRLFWKIAFGLALIVTALGYETWLDFLVFAWLASAVVAWLLWRQGDRERLRRLGAVLAAMTAAGIAYVFIKVNYGYGQQPGMETDLVFNYPYLAPAIEDVVSNIFMNFYMTATIFLPPMFVTSTAFYRLGGDSLVNLQHGYHAPFTYLVPMQAMFMWRYFAGVLAAIFVYGGVRTLKAASRTASFDHFAALVFMIMMATGGPTHMFIKARPFNAMAVQTYHVMTALLGVSLLVSLLLSFAWRRWPRLWPGGVLIAASWAVMFYSALARPGMISHEAAQSGLGVQIFPNPMATLMTKLGRPFVAPGGLALYQLMKYAPTADASPAAPAQHRRPKRSDSKALRGRCRTWRRRSPNGAILPAYRWRKGAAAGS